MLHATRRVLLVPLWTFAFVPGRAAMFAERLRRGRVGAARDLQRFGFPVLLPQRSQHALRSKWSFAQANPYCVVDRIRDRRDSGRQRAFAGFLGAERTLGVDALDDNALDFR